MVRKRDTGVSKNLTSHSSSENILLEEYRALQGDYIQQRGEGVTRMNFFITAMSVILGGVLVFASGNNNTTMISDFKLVLLVALTIMITIGIDVYGFLTQRNINIDRDIRGMARIRSYFVNLDSDLEKFFINSIDDTPTAFLIAKGSGMRRSTEIIVGFLAGFASAILSSYYISSLEINIIIAIMFTILTASFLEYFARRKLGKAR
jgi:hypothetical protein